MAPLSTMHMESQNSLAGPHCTVPDILQGKTWLWRGKGDGGGRSCGGKGGLENLVDLTDEGVNMEALTW